VRGFVGFYDCVRVRWRSKQTNRAVVCVCVCVGRWVGAWDFMFASVCDGDTDKQGERQRNMPLLIYN